MESYCEELFVELDEYVESPIGQPSMLNVPMEKRLPLPDFSPLL